MSLHDELNEALDGLDGAGTVAVDRPGGHAEVEVVDADRLGVSVRRVRVHREAPVDVVDEAAALPERLRALPERVAPVEVDASLGGARLRTRPDELTGRDYFEVDVAPHDTVIRRTRIGEDGERWPADFTLTREQLERLIEQSGGSPH